MSFEVIFSVRCLERKCQRFDFPFLTERKLPADVDNFKIFLLLLLFSAFHAFLQGCFYDVVFSMDMFALYAYLPVCLPVCLSV